VPRPTCDDECVPVAEARPQRRKVDSLREEPALFAQVAHGVVGERFQCLRDPTLLLRERRRELLRLERPSGCDARPVPIEARASHGQQLAVAHVVEQRGALSVDQTHAASHEQKRPRIRETPGVGRRHVHDHAHTRLDQLLCRHPVEIGVVDDRDVVRFQPAREVLGPPVEPSRPRVLDERSKRGHRTVCRNSWPPSIRRTSSCLPSSSSCSIRVCVGSPGTFWTLKWRSATVAICGRCVIVIT
jgi:hypothetical protein